MGRKYKPCDRVEVARRMAADKRRNRKMARLARGNVRASLPIGNKDRHRQEDRIRNPWTDKRTCTILIPEMSGMGNVASAGLRRSC